MAAGKFRHRITLQSPTRSEGSDRQVVSTWSDVATISAEVQIVGGSEAIEHRGKRGSIDASIRVRYSPTTAAIRADWRFVFNGMTFNITEPPYDASGDRNVLTFSAQAKPGLA